MIDKELQTIQELKEEISLLKKELKQYKEHDALTGLYNRFAFQRIVDTFLLQDAQMQDSAAFLMLDIDNFKQINDSLGHMQGDRTLQKIADILCKTFRKNAAIARFGGDEFAVFVTDTSVQALCTLAQTVCNALNQIRFDSPVISLVAVSIGIVFLENKDLDFYSLYQRADKALYKAKEKGKNTYFIYS